jgi:hypothetical protein
MNNCFGQVFGSVMILLGVLLVLFYGLILKKKEVGKGLGTPEKRIHVYVAFGIGSAFVGGGTILVIFVRGGIL